MNILPADINSLAKEVSQMRIDILFDDYRDEGLDLSYLSGIEEQYVLLALSCLEQAERFFKLAALNLEKEGE